MRLDLYYSLSTIKVITFKILVGNFVQSDDFENQILDGWIILIWIPVKYLWIMKLGNGFKCVRI
jgi:hypothetical protein